MIAKLIADLTNQCFATSLRDRTVPGIVLTQNNQEPFELYLARPTGALRWPLQLDPDSGNASLSGPALTLCSPGAGGPLTLALPAALTPIRNGFTGILDLATAEILAFLGNLAERPAVLSLDWVDAGKAITPFQGPVLVRQNAAAQTVTAINQLSGTSAELTLAAVGTTDLAPDKAFIQWFQHVTAGAGAGPYTHKLTLDSARALKGANFVLEIDIPATSNPTIQIYDNSVSGALLDTIAGDSDNATTYRFEAVLDGTTWKKENAAYL